MHAFSSVAEESIGKYEQLISDKHASDSQKCIAYSQLAKHYEFSHHDSSKFYLKAGIDYFSKSTYKKGFATLTLLQAGMDLKVGEMTLALKRLDLANDLYAELKDSAGIAELWNMKGELYGRKGDFVTATRYLTQTLSLSSRLKIHRTQASACLKMGVINEQNGNLDKALDYYNQSLKINETLALTSDIACLYNNIGIIYGKKDSISTAIQFFNRALEMGKSINSFQEPTLLAYQNLSIAYLHLGDREKAISYSQQALQLTEEENQPEHYARILYNMSGFYEGKESGTAIALLKKALQKTEQIEANLLRSDILNQLSEVYAQNGDFKTALDFKNRHDDLNDSLFSLQKAAEISNLQSLYELEASKIKISELNLQKKKQALERNLIITCVAFLILIIVGLSVSQLRIMRLNNKLKASEEVLEETNKIKDKLFGIIGHDLKGPVGNIQALLTIYENPATQPEQKSIIFKSMKSVTDAALDKLNELLLWGQAQIKGIVYDPHVINAGQYISSNMKLKASEAEMKNIKITSLVDPNLTIFADPAHFDLIIRNLLSNSIKYTDQNGEIEIEMSRELKPGFTVFAVRDNGIGLTKTTAQSIFLAKNQSISGTMNEKGTSLGLLLCRQYVEQNGGTIWVESEPGKGATFFFTIPDRT